MTDFMKLVDESGISLPDGRPWPEDAPKMSDPGNLVYVTRIDSAGEYLTSFTWLKSIFEGLLAKEAGSIEEPRMYELVAQARKYMREVDRRSMYDLMCKRLQRAKIGASTETRLVLESIIADIEKEFL